MVMVCKWIVGDDGRLEMTWVKEAEHPTLALVQCPRPLQTRWIDRVPTGAAVRYAVAANERPEVMPRRN